MKTFWNKYKIYLWLVAVLVVIWSLLWTAYKFWIIPKAGTAVSESVFPRDTDQDYWISTENDTIETSQVVCVTSDQLIGFGVIIQSKAQIKNLTAKVSVYNAQTGECMLDQEKVLDEFEGDQYVSMMFEDKLTQTKGLWLRINMTLMGSDLEEIRILGTNNSEYENYETIIDGKKVKQTILVEQFISLAHFLIPLFKAFIVLITVFIVLFSFFVFRKKWPVERLYLFAVLYLGMLYSLIIIPFAVPDEGMHANTIYRITNEILHVPETGHADTIYKRASDVDIKLKDKCNRDQYYEVYSHFFDKSSNDELVETSINDTGVLPVMYAPAIIGFLISRLLGFGPVLMYMISRWLMLVFFAIVTYRAMKLLPFGKAALFVICILPISLQQAASLSYDAVAIPITILFVSLCFHVAFSKDRISKKEIIEFFVLGILLTFVKGGAYFPLLLLLLVIPAEKAGGTKKKWLYFSSFLAILIIIFIIVNMAYVSRAVGNTATDDVELYTLGYLLSHPSEIFYVLNFTFLGRTAEYISTMIGYKLGYLNIYLNDLIVFGYIIILGLASLETESEDKSLSVNQKAWMALSIIGCIGLVLLSMWIFITPLGNPMISGVQGRYFIPVLWLELMLLKNRNLIFKRNVERGIIFSAIILELLSFVYLFQSIFA